MKKYSGLSDFLKFKNGVVDLDESCKFFKSKLEEALSSKSVIDESIENEVNKFFDSHLKTVIKKPVLIDYISFAICNENDKDFKEKKKNVENWIDMNSMGNGILEVKRGAGGGVFRKSDFEDK